MYAIVRIGKNQYSVKPNDLLEVDRMVGEVGSLVKFSDVLLLSDDKKIHVGTPLVKGAVVTGKIVAHDKGQKIQVRRYKSKVRYRKQTGFRAYLTKLEITNIAAHE